MWVMNFLPNWIFHAILAAGVLGLLSTFVLRFIPFFKIYELPIQIFSILVISIGVWFEGALSNQAAWEERVKEMESKVVQAEVKSVEANVEIVTQVVNKTKIIREKGKDIINYVDREVVKNQEVIKFVENCPIPDIIIKTHNAAALNQPIEIIKEIDPPAPAVKAEPEIKNLPQTQIAAQEPVVIGTAKVIAWANIRPTKDITGEKIEKLAPGTQLEVLKIEGGYAFVKGNKQGWVGREFLTIVKKV